MYGNGRPLGLRKRIRGADGGDPGVVPRRRCCTSGAMAPEIRQCLSWRSSCPASARFAAGATLELRGDATIPTAPR